MRFLRTLLFSSVLISPLGVVDAETCAPGNGACTERSDHPAPSSPSNAIEGCSVPGSWTSSYTGSYVVNEDLTGTATLTCTGPMTVSLVGTTGFHVDVAGVQPTECVAYVEDLTFVNCNIATGPWRNLDGSNAGTDLWSRLPTPSVDITASDARIPSDSRIISGGSVPTAGGGPVLTHADLSLTVTDNGSPAVGQNVTLKSDRALQDTFTQPGPSDFAGHATAAIETRRQPGPSTVTSSSGEVLTNTPAVINWLPARYESSFETSCYITSLEADFASDPAIVTSADIPGLPSGHSYHKSFVNDVVTQGTGLGLDNAYLHYNGGGHFVITACSVTKSGACARDGTTLAVDPTVIPMLSTVSIASIGERTAQDTGGKILDYKADIYYGVRRAACVAAGRPVRTIDLKHY